jgi:Ulp1 protease family, C-terminal catalytic domain
MFYYDSLPPADEYVAYLLFKKIWKLLKLTCSLVSIQGLPEHWTVGIPKGPRQKNGHDCGLYVCQAMRAAMLGIQLQVNPAMMPTFRKGIRKSFVGWASAPQPNNLELLQANEMFTALTIPGSLLATLKTTKRSQQPTNVMELGEYSLIMFTGTLRPAFED